MVSPPSEFEPLTAGKRLAAAAAASAAAALVYALVMAIQTPHTRTRGDQVMLWLALVGAPVFASECVRLLFPRQAREAATPILAWSWGANIAAIAMGVLANTVHVRNEVGTIALVLPAIVLAGPFVGTLQALRADGQRAGAPPMKSAAVLGTALGVLLVFVLPCPSLPERWKAHQRVPRLAVRGVQLGSAVDTLHRSLKHPVSFFVCEDLLQRPVSLSGDAAASLWDVVEALGRQAGAKVKHYRGGYGCPRAFVQLDCDPFVPSGRYWFEDSRLDATSR